MRGIKRMVAVLSLSIAATAGTVNASIQTEVTSVTGGFQWTYGVEITGLEEVRAGDFFTIYDFAGYINGSIEAPNADWDAYVQNFGPAGPNQSSAVDDPNVVNLVFLYKNAGVNLDNALITPLDFKAKSIYGSKTDGWSSSQTTSLRIADRKNGSTDDAVVPTAVPLPAASWLGLALLTTLGAARAVRRRQAQA